MDAKQVMSGVLMEMFRVSFIGQADTVKMPLGGWSGWVFLAPDPSLTIMYYVYVRSQLSSYLVKLHIQGAYQTTYILPSIYKHTQHAT